MNIMEMTKDDVIDYSTGVVVNKKINDFINVGDTIFTIYSNRKIENIDIRYGYNLHDCRRSAKTERRTPSFGDY
jgi:thymidine phosphorylase